MKDRLSRGLVIVLGFLTVTGTVSGNVVGPDIQNFNPTSGGVDFLTVHSSETLDPGIFNFGLFFNYAVNSLPLFSDGDSLQSRTKINDTLLMTDLNMGLGLFKNFEIGFSYPRLLDQSIRSDVPRGQFGSSGNTELRFMGKYRFYGHSAGGMAAILSTNVNRIINNPYTGSDSKPTINFELAMDSKLWGLATGLNLGYRLHQSGKPITGSSIKPTEDQVVASGAISYLVRAIDTKIITEIFGSRAAAETNSPASNRQASSLELIGGLKHDYSTRIAIHGGVGTELISGAASPDWRVYLGVNLANGPLFGRKKRSGTRVIRRIRPKVSEPEIVEIIQIEDPLEVPPEPGEIVITLDSVEFEFDSDHRLLEGASETLERLANYLRKPPVFKKLSVEGHTDSVGTVRYNIGLSIRRARRIRTILVEKFGISLQKVEALGFGEGRSVDDNGNYQGRQRNRRVEFKILR